MIDSETVLAIMAKEAAVDPSRLTPNATLDDLSITSLDVLNILFAIEDKYHLQFEPAEFEKVRTVQEFTSVIFAKMNVAPGAAAAGAAG
ncbi:MAG: acyl carrier protein [Alphaproteobacteria bacterium]|nr:acyl carrier protein [Alphaproteobacteria bacterium]